MTVHPDDLSDGDVEFFASPGRTPTVVTLLAREVQRRRGEDRAVKAFLADPNYRSRYPDAEEIV